MAPPKKLRAEGPGGSPTNRWSQLPSELLELVAGHLGFPDLVRFGAVCTTWRSAAFEERRRCRRGGEPMSLRLPRLLLHRATHCGTKPRFFSTWRHRYLDLDLPEAFGGAARCCGSSWGWLAMVDDAEFDICLLNPVTRALVQLPSRSQFPFRPQVTPGEGRRDPVRYVRKVVLSSDPASRGCTVAAIGRSNMLALCRPGSGDARWAVFEGEHGGGYEDVAFHGDQLCALDFRGRLTVCSLAASAPGVTNFAVVEPSEDVGGQQSCYQHRHLVGSSGELLMVVREYYAGAVDASAATALRVFKLGMNGWDPVESLGDRMLFVGEISSESMSADGVAEVPGFRANSICFTSRLVERATPHAYGLFSIETGCAFSISVADTQLLREEPVWVMATLR